MVRLAALCAVLLVAGLASAQDEKKGWYLGGGVAAALEDFNVPSKTSIDEGFTFEVFAGYRLNRMFALEAEFEFLDNAFELKGNVGGVDFSGDIDGFSYTGSAKFYPFAIGETVEPFLQVGAGILDIVILGDDQESEWLLQFGAGVDFAVAEQWALELRGRYNVPTGTLDDLRYWTVGLSVIYQFP